MKKSILIPSACLSILLSATVQSAACDLCAVYRSLEAKSANPGFNVGIFEQFTHFGTLQQDGHKVDNPANQSLDSSITQFIVGYQVNDRFGVQLNTPYIIPFIQTPHPHGEHRQRDGVRDWETSPSSGITAPSSIPPRRPSLSWDLSAGVKFPTGSRDRIKEELSEMEPDPGVPESGIHGHDLALGSGSYDGIVGTALFASWQRLFVVRRAAVHYPQPRRLRLPLRQRPYLACQARGLPLALPPGFTRAAAGRFREDKGKDDLAGVKAEDTGMTSVFAGPELSFTWKDKLSAELGAEFPLVNDNTALQLVPDYRVKAAVTYRF